MREPQPDGTQRLVGLHELRPEHFRIPAEDLPATEPQRPLTPKEQDALRRERALARTAHRMGINWEEGGNRPLVREYVGAVTDTETLQSDLTNAAAPGHSENAGYHDAAEVLLRAEYSGLTRSLPYAGSRDTWHHMAGKLDVAGRYFGIRVYNPLEPEPVSPSTGVWKVPDDHFDIPEEFDSPLPLEQRLAARDEEAQGSMQAMAERYGFHPDFAGMDPGLQRLLYHRAQAEKLVTTTEHALSQPEEPGLTPPAHTRLRSAHAINLLVRDVLDIGLTGSPVPSERAAAYLQQAAAPYGLLVDLQRIEPQL